MNEDFTRGLRVRGFPLQPVPFVPLDTQKMAEHIRLDHLVEHEGLGRIDMTELHVRLHNHRHDLDPS